MPTKRVLWKLLPLAAAAAGLLALPLAWYVAAAVESFALDPAAAQALQQMVVKRSLVSALLITTLMTVFGFAALRRIVNPLRNMERGAARFARGRFNRKVPLPRVEELRTVAVALNSMADQLKEKLTTVGEQRRQLDAVLDSLEDGVLAVQADEQVVIINHAALRMLGSPLQQGEGRSLQEIARSPALQNFIKRSLAANELLTEELLLRQPAPRYLRVTARPLHNDDSERIGSLLVLNDETLLRRLERMRSDFVANVSHELKTPITSIKGFIETLIDGADTQPEERQRFLGIVARQSDRLQAIIEDLLGLARLEQEHDGGGITVEETSIPRLLELAVQMTEARAADKGMQLLLESPEEILCHVNPALLEQAVVNLIDNAIKYSPPETFIRITAAAAGEEVRISVTDQGNGIEERHLPRLFERFYRVDKARSRELGGTGLGLALVKHIAQAHRGCAEVDSAVGRGSTFTITLPNEGTDAGCRSET